MPFLQEVISVTLTLPFLIFTLTDCPLIFTVREWGSAIDVITQNALVLKGSKYFQFTENYMIGIFSILDTLMNLEPSIFSIKA